MYIIKMFPILPLFVVYFCYIEIKKFYTAKFIFIVFIIMCPDQEELPYSEITIILFVLWLIIFKDSFFHI